MQRLAFGKYYAIRPNHELSYVGLDEKLKQNRQIVFVTDRFFISRGIHVFTNIVQKEPIPASNRVLLMETNGERMQDTFNHEQVLIIEEAGKTLLVTGCAHNGIVNILEHFHDFTGRMPDYVIGGSIFPAPRRTRVKFCEIDAMAKYLLSTNASIIPAMQGMEPSQAKPVMGDSIGYLAQQ